MKEKFAAEEKYKLFAFTLAEVLITLAVVGVVASMTIPILVRTYIKQSCLVKYRQTYAILDQATREYMQNNGGSMVGFMTNDYLAGSSQAVASYAPYFKNSKIIPAGNGHECFPQPLHGDPAQVGWDTAKDYPCMVLPTGAVVSFVMIDHSCNWTYTYGSAGDVNKKCGTFVMDINGYQEPNIMGVDWFQIILNKDGILPVGVPNADYGGDALRSGLGYCEAYGSTCSKFATLGVPYGIPARGY